MNFFDDNGFGWEEMAMAGFLGEEMAEDEIERRKLERELCDEDVEDLEFDTEG